MCQQKAEKGKTIRLEPGFTSLLLKDDSGIVLAGKREEGLKPKSPLSSFQNIFHLLRQKEYSLVYPRIQRREFPVFHLEKRLTKPQLNPKRKLKKWGEERERKMVLRT